jgi:hypothetical protein
MYNCCTNIGNRAQTRTVTLKFRRKNLDYSIENYAYIEGHIMPDEAEHNRHMVKDVLADGNRDRVTRTLAVVHAAVIEMLYPFTKAEAIEEAVEDSIFEPEVYIVEITVPSTFSRTSVHLLSKLIHEFMVYNVLADWLSITNEQASQRWIQKAQEAKAEIDSVKNMRTGALTRPFQPF